MLLNNIMSNLFKYYNNRSSKPGIPTAVSAEAGNTQCTVSWTAPSSTGGAVSISKYNVYILRDIYYGGYVYYGGSTTTTLNVTGLTAGTVYGFKVSAVNSDDIEGDQSASASATPTSSTSPKPNAPTNVIGELGTSSGTVTVRWTASSGATSYNVYYMITTYGGDILCGTSTGTLTSISGLTNGTPYFFKVSAINSIGEGDKSSASSSAVTPGAVPDAPTNVSVTEPAAGNVTVSWTAPQITGGYPIISYTVKYSTDATSYISYGIATGTSITVSGLNNGDVYTFKVVATNAVGNSLESIASNAVKMYYSTVTDAGSIADGGVTNGTQYALVASNDTIEQLNTQTGLTTKLYTTTDGSNIVALATNKNTDGSPQNYLVATSNNELIQLNPITLQGTSITTLPEAPKSMVPYRRGGSPLLIPGNVAVVQTNAGTILDVPIPARNVRSAGFNLTREVTVTTIVTGLSQPFGITINGNYMYVTQQGPGTKKIARITLNTEGTVIFVDRTWSQYEFTNPTDISVAGNYIYVIDTTLGFTVQLNLADGSLVNDAFSIVNEDSVGIVSIGGNIYTTNTSEGTIYIAPEPTVPGTTILTGVAGYTQANLSWLTPSSDGGVAIENYNIIGGTDPTFVTTFINLSVNPVATDPQTKQINNLVTGTTYYFKVRAVNGVGNGAYSNIVAVTPTEIICFLKGSKILTNNGYVEVENLQKGMLVKTLRNGYVPINMLSSRVIYNSGDNERIKDRLYRCKQGVFEDLVITGGHSILVNGFKAGEKEKVIDLFGEVMMTDKKYRLPACVDENMEPYHEKGNFTVYHLALDCYDNNRNFGIYANGLLVESCSKNYLKVMMGTRKTKL